MLICRARKEHLLQINALAESYGLSKVPPSCLSRTDIAIVAIADNGAVVGFIWIGLMAQRTIGYVDFYLVDPAHAKQGYGAALGREMIRRCKRMGVKTLIGSIRRDQWHDQSAVNALKVAFGADTLPHTALMGDVNTMSRELNI